MGVWESITSAIQIGKLAATDGAALIRAALAAHGDIVSGKTIDPVKALMDHASEIMPVIEDVIGLLFPGATVASIGISVVAYIITHAHKMSPEEEARWMDRASQASG